MRTGRSRAARQPVERELGEASFAGREPCLHLAGSRIVASRRGCTGRGSCRFVRDARYAVVVLDRLGCDGARRRQRGAATGQPIDPATAGRDADRDQLRRLTRPRTGPRASLLWSNGVQLTPPTGHDDVAGLTYGIFVDTDGVREALVDRHPDRHQRRGNRPDVQRATPPWRSTSANDGRDRAHPTVRPSSHRTLHRPRFGHRRRRAEPRRRRLRSAGLLPRPLVLAADGNVFASMAHQAVDIEFDPHRCRSSSSRWNELIAIPSGSGRHPCRARLGAYESQDQFISDRTVTSAWVHGVDVAASMMRSRPGPAVPVRRQGRLRRAFGNFGSRRLRAPGTDAVDARSRSRASVAISLWSQTHNAGRALLSGSPARSGADVRSAHAATIDRRSPDNSSSFLADSTRALSRAVHNAGSPLQSGRVHTARRDA